MADDTMDLTGTGPGTPAAPDSTGQSPEYKAYLARKKQTATPTGDSAGYNGPVTIPYNGAAAPSDATGSSGRSPEYQAFLAQQASHPGMTRTLLEQPLNAFLGGFAPKLAGAEVGAAAAIKDRSLSSFLPAYEKERDTYARDLATEQEDRPLTSLGAQAVGAYLSPVNRVAGTLAARVIPGTTVASNVGRAAVEGGVIGGTTAVGATRGSPQDYIVNAGLGTVLGTGIGAGTGAAGQLVGKLVAPSRATVDAGYDAMRARPGYSGPTSIRFNDLVNTDPAWGTAYENASANAVRAGAPAFPNRNVLGQNDIPPDILDATQREFYSMNERGQVGSGSRDTRNASRRQLSDLLAMADRENASYAPARTAFGQNAQRRDMIRGGLTAGFKNPLTAVTSPLTIPYGALKTIMPQPQTATLPALLARNVGPIAANMSGSYLSNMLDDSRR